MIMNGKYCSQKPLQIRSTNSEIILTGAVKTLRENKGV